MSTANPSLESHLAKLASSALSRADRCGFVRAYREFGALSDRMRSVANEIVDRAEAMTIQDSGSRPAPTWSEEQMATFNRWLERLQLSRDDEIKALCRRRETLSMYLEDVARGARFRSADGLARALGLLSPQHAAAANEP
ncbi:MAG: hypothetical protein Q8R98_24475 [Rubrivivax sp.]|nr:hypothetical protein [Rubrivivax sp.]MDZ4053443.1 hypothetical protein [Phenylobacterium sp.]